MPSFLKNPYPFLFSTKRNFVVAFLVGLLVFTVNQMLSNESTVAEILKVSQRTLSISFGIITLLSILLTLQLIPKFFISHNTIENWRISNELALISFLHLFIIAFNFTFILFALKDISEISIPFLLLKMTIGALIIGLLPSSVIVWLNYTLRLKENLKQVQKHNAKLEEILQSQKVEEAFVRIPSENKTETIEFSIHHLLYIKSDGNYIEVFSHENNQVQKTVHRASLKTIEKELSNFPNIVRTHRSYLVNCKNIKLSRGTARNYQLYFQGIEEPVPVARNQFLAFNESISTLLPIQNI